MNGPTVHLALPIGLPSAVEPFGKTTFFGGLCTCHKTELLDRTQAVPPESSLASGIRRDSLPKDPCRPLCPPCSLCPRRIGKLLVGDCGQARGIPAKLTQDPFILLPTQLIAIQRAFRIGWIALWLGLGDMRLSPPATCAVATALLPVPRSPTPVSDKGRP